MFSQLYLICQLQKLLGSFTDTLITSHVDILHWSLLEDCLETTVGSECRCSSQINFLHLLQEILYQSLWVTLDVSCFWAKFSMIMVDLNSFTALAWTLRSLPIHWDLQETIFWYFHLISGWWPLLSRLSVLQHLVMKLVPHGNSWVLGFYHS